MRYLIVLLLLCSLSSADERADQTFRQWDRNKDGKLSRSELPRFAQANFERVDSDKDGFISLAEHRAFLNRPRQQNRPGASERIQIHSDLRYAKTENARQTLDLYLPRKRAAETRLPLIVWIHGGGWRAGDKRSGLNRLRRFVQSGRYFGASIGYRLSSEAKWPAQIHDCKAAIRWLRANADLSLIHI